MTCLSRTCADLVCHCSACNSSYSVLQMTGQTLLRKGMPSRDGCIQDLEGRQHNYVNTPTSHDPEQTPADVNGRREDYGSYNQLLYPVNLPLTSASLYLISYQHSHYWYIRHTTPVFCHRLLSLRSQVEMKN